MKTCYFSETGALLSEFRDTPVAATRDQDTLLDLDADGNTCAIVVEHAPTCTDIPRFLQEQVAA
jgi:uncharacterized protein YuzE